MTEIAGAVSSDRALLRDLSEDEFIRLSKAQVGTLVDAIKQDLETLAHKGMSDNDRLAKVEMQTRLLAKLSSLFPRRPKPLLLRFGL